MKSKVEINGYEYEKWNGLWLFPDGEEIDDLDTILVLDAKAIKDAEQNKTEESLKGS